MSGFDPGWLTLREPYDAWAREIAGLTPAFAALLPERPRLLDLGCGTGANVRYLLLRLDRTGQRWTTVDIDPVLLKRVPTSFPPWVEGVEKRQMDLNDVDVLDVAGHDAVVTTALIDLVSEGWMTRLADRIVASRRPFFATLTVDGRVQFETADPDDGFVMGLVDRHMGGDKGFGPSLGGRAPTVAERLFAARGYAVRTATSDWTLTPEDADLQHALIYGYASAAKDLAPDALGRIAAWADRRHAHLCGLTVGHVDLLAVPAQRG
jgi:SAM-dependent methyltransferase